MTIEQIEEFKQWIYDQKYGHIDYIIDFLDELGPFELGRLQGRMHAYDEVTEEIRKRLKSGEWSYEMHEELEKNEELV